MKFGRWVAIGVAVVVLAGVFAVVVDNADANARLVEAIAKTPTGAEKGMLPKGGEPGYLGIPGGSQTFCYLWFIVGHLGRLDLLLSGGLRRHHGRSGSHHHLRAR